jgi:hypothetical protein
MGIEPTASTVWVALQRGAVGKLHLGLPLLAKKNNYVSDDKKKID